jgi:uridylate kinase
LGGSVIAPERVDTGFLRGFFAMIRLWLGRNPDSRLILVTGGGAPARVWQAAYRDAAGAEALDDEADWIGVMATRLNAQLVKALAGSLCPQDVVTDPSNPGVFVGRVLVASGWKPGFSSDFDAVLLAERFGADTVINLSNIEKVYTADPRTDPLAQPIDAISWPQFRKLVGNTWVPGRNVPFDPVASREAERAGLRVLCAAGKNLENLRKILDGEPFTGTVIGVGKNSEQ